MLNIVPGSKTTTQLGFGGQHKENTQIIAYCMHNINLSYYYKLVAKLQDL